MTINIKGYDLLIDDEDYDKISKFHWTSIKSKTIGLVYFKCCKIKKYKRNEFYLHRFIMNRTKGDNSIIDHINGNTLDNRKSNLRICNNFSNQWNSRKHIDNKSGYKGVYFNKNAGKYRAYIQKNKISIHLGTFNCPTAAWFARIKAAKMFHGEFARY